MQGKKPSGTPLTPPRVRVPENLSYDFVKDMLNNAQNESDKMSEHSSIYGDEDDDDYS